MTDLRMPEKKFRPELEGVRAVAALLVAVYHIWIGSVSGGVDVFFIVSGYLITTSLLSRMERDGKINFIENLLGLAKRLIPLSFTVLLVTALLSIWILPQTFWKQTISELFSSMFYFQNWQLATSAVDYLGQNNEASPLQHFWALSIQGQFYITWPFIITAVYLLAKKVLKMPVRKTLLTALVAIFAVSLGYSIYITEANQPWAYFDTFARAWEFSLGGILALLIPYLTFNKAISFIIGWIGLAIICFTGMLLPVSSVFPGYAALLPTMGVIFVIIAAENTGRFGVQRLLSTKPFMYFGSISYGFYLWHWPLLVFYYAYFSTATVSLQAGLAILTVSFILSVITSKLIEAPVRGLNVRQSKRQLGKVLVAIMLPVILVGASWNLYVQASLNEEAAVEYSVEEYPGARVVSENIVPAENVAPVPSPALAKGDLPIFYKKGNCSTYSDNPDVNKCSFGETENPDYIIALVGGSHSGHWFPALETIAPELKLQIDVYIKDACRFTTDDLEGALTESCMEWNETVTEMLKNDPPDMIFTTANVQAEDNVPRGYIEKWEVFEGITEIFAVRDNPRMPKDIPSCMEETPEECSVPREEVLSAVLPWENTENLPGNVTFFDTSPYFCDDETCPPAIGNVLVYRDEHHLTTLYSKTMGPVLAEDLKKALDGLDRQ
ncbi:acyltransferase family protein [Planococcus shenhongbingii]|uniref:acyltransferase family protein n=1 Tax=Planococcus shenhongbingii TaxID=3058398 RepID=UPI00263460C6|nr:acyltransferase family protein [Planococcus sp. N016]WKA57781.1 acyltransferase family protein [Planococcus sp. N016]